MENQHEELRETGGNLAGRIEAILFVAGEPVRIEELAKALGVSVREIETELVRIRDEYDFHQRGFTLKRFGHQVQLATRALYSADVVHLLQPVQKQSLSQAAMETLAVVAYKQPVTRAEVEQVRGVKCDYSLQSLMNKELIVEVGRKDTLGRPILYGTTENFLAHFGLTTLEDLPPMPEAPQPEKPEDPDFDVPELVP
jgi:segregation and condensation protein B